MAKTSIDNSRRLLAQANLFQALDDITSFDWPIYLRASGLPFKRAYPRDRREPGKTHKEEYEDKLAAIMLRHFRRQSRRIRERLEQQAPERKAILKPDDVDFDDIFEDNDEWIAELARLLTTASVHGIALFGERVAIGMDYTLTNARAAEWAREYSFDLVKGINDVSQRILRESISGFVETPGMTIGDVMDVLPFTEERAMSVAVTEITRAYAEANQLAGMDLRKEFPDVRIIKTWFTNNDDRVCEICLPLDGDEKELDEGFGVEEGEGLDGPPAHVNCRCWLETTTALAELD